MRLSLLKTVDVQYCKGFSDDAIASYVLQAPAALETLELEGTNASVPEATQEQGLAAVRQYYEQLQADAVISEHLKVVITGNGRVGKTSLVQRLQEHYTGGTAKPLPSTDDRTIGVEMATLKGSLVMYDFGGQPEYWAWHKLFLTAGAMYLVVVDLTDSTETCTDALREQLGILSCSVPGAVVLLVGTKADADIADAQQRASELNSWTGNWLAERRKVAVTPGVHGQREQDAAAELPRIQGDMLITSSRSLEGIAELAQKIDALSVQTDPERLFKWYKRPIPKVYQQVGVLLQGIKIGLSKSELLETVTQCKVAENEHDVQLQFVSMKEIKTLWESVATEAQVTLKDASAHEVLQVALPILEGEGFVLLSPASGIIHVNPAWLADAVRPLADHRLHQKAHMENTAQSMEDQQLFADYDRAFHALEEFAQRGIASQPLLEALWVDVLKTYSVDYATLNDLLCEHKLMFPAAGDRSSDFIVPVKLPKLPPEEFAALCASSSEAAVVVGKVRTRFIPPGLMQMVAAALHHLGQYRCYFRYGGVLEDATKSERIIYYMDVAQYEVHIRVHGQSRLVQRINEVAGAVQSVILAYRGLGVSWNEVQVVHAAVNVRQLESGIKAELMAELHRELKKCPTFEDVQAMLEARTAEIKAFVGNVCKSLPRPTRVEVSRKWLGTRKVVRLMFVCPVTGFELAVESRCWSLWLKFCVSLAQAGVHVLKGDLIEAAGSSVDIVKSAYDAYHENETDQESFEALLRAPLLLSSEQDQLIQGLRDQHFFDDFQYDAQRGEWIATPSAAARAEAASALDIADIGSSLWQAASAAADGDVVGAVEAGLDAVASADCSQTTLHHEATHQRMEPAVSTLQRQSSVIGKLETLGIQGLREGDLDLVAGALEELGFDTSDSLQGVGAVPVNVLRTALERQGVGLRAHGLTAKVHMALLDTHPPETDVSIPKSCCRVM